MMLFHATNTWFYATSYNLVSSTQNPCSSNPCGNGSTCVAKRVDDDYNPKWKVVVLAVCDVLRPIDKDVVWKAKTACPARICGFTTSILKSLDCDPCKLTGSHRCDLITNRTILCS